MQSCYKKVSDVRMLSLKDTVYKKDALVHAHDFKGMVHWSQLCQGEKKMTEFVQCPMFRKHRYGIDGVGLPPSHASCAELQQTSPGSLGAPAPPALQPFSSSQPTMSWLSNTSARHFPPSVSSNSTAPLLIQSLA